jgi:hypothetical protein
MAAARAVRAGFPVASRALYDSCVVRSPEGAFLFHCSHKKAEWYLSRGLGERVFLCQAHKSHHSHRLSAEEIVPSAAPTDEKSITPSKELRLKFTPSGPGRADDEYYEAPVANCCVVCGAASSLIRHHVIPREFRQHFPVELKSHSSHDIVGLCTVCAMRYSAAQSKLKKALLAELAIPVRIVQPTPLQRQAKKAALTLLDPPPTAPPTRIVQLRAAVAEYLNVQEVGP